jgi:hypothetical protein
MGIGAKSRTCMGKAEISVVRGHISAERRLVVIFTA